MTTRRSRLLALSIIICVATTAAQAQQVWENPTLNFTKNAFADPSVEKDQITPNVALTRGDTQGLFNIVAEASYSFFSSPADTEWATGAAADWASLTFDNWQAWAASNPPGTVGVDAVVHLISDDIYIDIRFLEWGIGSSGGGSFSYIRAEAPPAVPTSTNFGLLIMGALLLALGTVVVLRRG